MSVAGPSPSKPGPRAPDPNNPGPNEPSPGPGKPRTSPNDPGPGTAASLEAPIAVDVAVLRRDYLLAALDEADVDPDPVAQFRRWLAAAVAAGVTEPSAMVVSSADATGAPSARTVLCKGVDERGFAFYTNRTSRKGAELAANPRAAVVFPWFELQRQVVIAGGVERVSDEEADVYFASRPRASQLGAWASRQSSVVAGRATLKGWESEATQRFGDGVVPRPPFWGGYRVVPLTIELWQGRPSRLHDRLRYRRPAPGRPWLIERLSP